MSSTRRSFLIESSALLAGVAVWKHPALLHLAESAFTWHAVRDDVWMVTGAGGNVTVIREGKGAIVVDTKSAGFGSVLRAEIEQRVGPVQAVLITHHHGDHLGGAYAFTGVESVAQRQLVARAESDYTRAMGRLPSDSAAFISGYLTSMKKDFEIKVSPDVERGVGAWLSGMKTGAIKAWTPSKSVEKSDTLTVGGTTLELHHLGSGHTDNDLYVVDRRRNVVVAGDLLFHEHHPFIDVGAGATTAGWQATLAEMTGACNASTAVVPGHGVVATRDGLATQSRYFDDVRTMVRKARQEGKSRDEARKLAPGPFVRYGFGDLWEENLGVLYDELARAS